MIIGLGYKARSGKDLVADILQRKKDFGKRAFAKPLKDACKAIFGLSDNQLYLDEKEIEDPFWETTPRDILQRVGTESFRHSFGENVWVDSWKKFIQSRTNLDWIVPDVRFPNEAAAIKDLGGYVVRVDRDDRDEISCGQRHESEIAMDDYVGWDYVINNNGSIKDLERESEIMLLELQLRSLKAGRV